MLLNKRVRLVLSALVVISGLLFGCGGVVYAQETNEVQNSNVVQYNACGRLGEKWKVKQEGVCVELGGIYAQDEINCEASEDGCINGKIQCALCTDEVPEALRVVGKCSSECQNLGENWRRKTLTNNPCSDRGGVYETKKIWCDRSGYVDKYSPGEGECVLCKGDVPMLAENLKVTNNDASAFSKCDDESICSTLGTGWEIDKENGCATRGGVYQRSSSFACDQSQNDNVDPNGKVRCMICANNVPDQAKKVAKCENVCASLGGGWSVKTALVGSCVGQGGVYAQRDVWCDDGQGGAYNPTKGACVLCGDNVLVNVEVENEDELKTDDQSPTIDGPSVEMTISDDELQSCSADLCSSLGDNWKARSALGACYLSGGILEQKDLRCNTAAAGQPFKAGTQKCVLCSDGAPQALTKVPKCSSVCKSLGAGWQKQTQALGNCEGRGGIFDSQSVWCDRSTSALVYAPGEARCVRCNDDLPHLARYWSQAEGKDILDCNDKKTCASYGLGWEPIGNNSCNGGYSAVLSPGFACTKTENGAQVKSQAECVRCENPSASELGQAGKCESVCSSLGKNWQVKSSAYGSCSDAGGVLLEKNVWCDTGVSGTYQPKLSACVLCNDDVLLDLTKKETRERLDAVASSPIPSSTPTPVASSSGNTSQTPNDGILPVITDVVTIDGTDTSDDVCAKADDLVSKMSTKVAASYTSAIKAYGRPILGLPSRCSSNSVYILQSGTKTSVSKSGFNVTDKNDRICQYYCAPCATDADCGGDKKCCLGDGGMRCYLPDETGQAQCDVALRSCNADSDCAGNTDGKTTCCVNTKRCINPKEETCCEKLDEWWNGNIKQCQTCESAYGASYGSVYNFASNSVSVGGNEVKVTTEMTPMEKAEAFCASVGKKVEYLKEPATDPLLNPSGDSRVSCYNCVTVEEEAAEGKEDDKDIDDPANEPNDSTLSNDCSKAEAIFKAMSADSQSNYQNAVSVYQHPIQGLPGSCGTNSAYILQDGTRSTVKKSGYKVESKENRMCYYYCAPCSTDADCSGDKKCCVGDDGKNKCLSAADAAQAKCGGTPSCSKDADCAGDNVCCTSTNRCMTAEEKKVQCCGDAYPADKDAMEKWWNNETQSCQRCEDVYGEGYGSVYNFADISESEGKVKIDESMSPMAKAEALCANRGKKVEVFVNPAGSKFNLSGDSRVSCYKCTTTSNSDDPADEPEDPTLSNDCSKALTTLNTLSDSRQGYYKNAVEEYGHPIQGLPGRCSKNSPYILQDGTWHRASESGFNVKSKENRMCYFYCAVCATDADCGGNKKCCLGQDGMRCYAPEDQYLADCQVTRACNKDADCSGDDVCCTTTRRCMTAEEKKVQCCGDAYYTNGDRELLKQWWNGDAQSCQSCKQIYGDTYGSVYNWYSLGEDNRFGVLTPPEKKAEIMCADVGKEVEDFRNPAEDGYNPDGSSRVSCYKCKPKTVEDVCEKVTNTSVFTLGDDGEYAKWVSKNTADNDQYTMCFNCLGDECDNVKDDYCPPECPEDPDCPPPSGECDYIGGTECCENAENEACKVFANSSGHPWLGEKSKASWAQVKWLDFDGNLTDKSNDNTFCTEGCNGQCPTDWTVTDIKQETMECTEIESKAFNETVGTYSSNSSCNAAVDAKVKECNDIGEPEDQKPDSSCAWKACQATGSCSYNENTKIYTGTMRGTRTEAKCPSDTKATCGMEVSTNYGVKSDGDESCGENDGLVWQVNVKGDEEGTGSSGETGANKGGKICNYSSTLPLTVSGTATTESGAVVTVPHDFTLNPCECKTEYFAATYTPTYPGSQDIKVTEFKYDSSLNACVAKWSKLTSVEDGIKGAGADWGDAGSNGRWIMNAGNAAAAGWKLETEGDNECKFVCKASTPGGIADCANKTLTPEFEFVPDLRLVVYNDGNFSSSAYEVVGKEGTSSTVCSVDGSSELPAGGVYPVTTTDNGSRGIFDFAFDTTAEFPGRFFTYTFNSDSVDTQTRKTRIGNVYSQTDIKENVRAGSLAEMVYGVDAEGKTIKGTTDFDLNVHLTNNYNKETQSGYWACACPTVAGASAASNDGSDAANTDCRLVYTPTTDAQVCTTKRIYLGYRACYSSAWWQVSGGNVFAQGDVIDYVPPAIQDSNCDDTTSRCVDTAPNDGSGYVKDFAEAIIQDSSQSCTPRIVRGRTPCKADGPSNSAGVVLSQTGQVLAADSKDYKVNSAKALGSALDAQELMQRVSERANIHALYAGSNYGENANNATGLQAKIAYSKVAAKRDLNTPIQNTTGNSSDTGFTPQREDYNYFVSLAGGNTELDKLRVTDIGEYNSSVYKLANIGSWCESGELTNEDDEKDKITTYTCYFPGDLVIDAKDPWYVMTDTKDGAITEARKYTFFVGGNLTLKGIDAKSSDGGIASTRLNDAVTAVDVGSYLGFIVKGNMVVNPDVGLVMPNPKAEGADTKLLSTCWEGQSATLNPNVYTKEVADIDALSGASAVGSGYDHENGPQYRSAVGSVEGVFIADGNLVIQRYEHQGCDPINTSDRRFISQGSLIVWGSTSFLRDFNQRDRGCQDDTHGIYNNRVPTETFIYRPDLVRNMPTWMRKVTVTYQDVTGT